MPAHLQLEPDLGHGDFKERNRGKIRSLIEQWRRSFQNKNNAKLVAPRDTKDALVLVNELVKGEDDLLSKTNLVQRYQLNRIAIPELCERMNAANTKTKGGSLGQVVTLASYMEFDKNRHWQWETGYRHPTTLTAADGNEPISGVSDEEREELKNAVGVDPRQVSLSPEQEVRGVSWYDAAAYCFFVGGRLPTREELSKLPASAEVKTIWEWSQSWFSEEEAHIAVAQTGYLNVGDVMCCGS